MGRRLSSAELLAAAAVLTASAFVVQPLFAQQASRMALTASLVEHQTVRIDRYEGGALGVDFAEKDGHIYSDKAPAQPFAATVPYALYKAAGGESAEVLRPEFNLGLWWVSLWSAALPAAGLAIVMTRMARPFDERWAVPAALAMSFGSLLLPFGTLLFSHTASALLVAGALLAWRAPPSPRSLCLAGLLAGLSVSVEYTSVVALAVLGLASLARDRWDLRWMVLGSLPPLALTAAYHWVAFGGPLEVPYRYHNLGLHNSAAAGLALPSPDRLWTLFTSGRGMFLLTPIVIVGVAGLVLAAREHQDRRPELAVIAAMLVGFVVVQAGAADLTGGDSLGPRYLIPGLPGLAVGVAVLWRKVPLLVTGVALFSAAMMLLGTYTDPLVAVGLVGVQRYWLGLIADGDVTRTLFDPVMGRAAAVAVVLGASAVLVIAALRANDRSVRVRDS